MIISHFKSITKQYIITRLSILAFLFFTVYIFGFNLNKVFFALDGERYLDIAINGYSLENYAFFPLTPLVIRFFNIFKIPTLGFVLFNIGITYITTIYIYKICKEIYKYNEKIIDNIMIFWIYSPIALFTIILYSDGLFLFFAVTTYYYCKKNKNNILTGFLLGLTVLTRSFGAMLFFALFINILIDAYMNKEEIKTTILRIFKIYIPATIISLIYPLYLLVKTGNLLYFSKIQFEYWNRIKSNIFMIIKKEIEMIRTADENISIIFFINWILIISALIYVIITLIKLKKDWRNNLDLIIYVVLTLFTCFSTMRDDGVSMPSCSMYRYIYGLFPIYMVQKGDINITISKNLFILLNLIITFNYGIQIFLT